MPKARAACQPAARTFRHTRRSLTPPPNSDDRGRDKGLNLAPPSEPDGRISRIRLSSQWVRSRTIVRVHSCSAFKLSSPRWANHAFGQR